VTRSLDEMCKIGMCKDKLSALVLYQANEQEWELAKKWLKKAMAEIGRAKSKWKKELTTEGEIILTTLKGL